MDGLPNARLNENWPRAALAKERSRLVIPAASAELDTLGSQYTSPALGNITVKREALGAVFDFDEWKSAVASRKNDDGTVSFITTDPGSMGFEFVRGERDGKSVLVTRDGQHEYVFTETR